MPLVFQDYPITDLQIPKTASTWRTRALNRSGVKQKHIQPRHEPTVPEGKDKFVFTFVRHPLPYMASRFYLKTVPGVPLGEMRVTKEKGFRRFIETYLENHAGAISYMTRQFTSKCHFVGKVETIADDLVTILRQNGIPFDEDILRNVPVTNATASKTEIIERYGPAEYTPELAKAVCEAEKWVIDRFYGDEENAFRS